VYPPQRLNNNYTVTGISTISAGDIGAICSRHGHKYVALFTDHPYITFKFMPLPEDHDVAAAHAPASASINIDNDVVFETTVARWLGCERASRKQNRGPETIVFQFEPKEITKEKADGLLASPAVAKVVIVPDGVHVIFARRSDCKSSVRYTKSTTPSMYYPRTARPDWMHRPSSLTAGSKRSAIARKHSSAAGRQKRTSLLDAAAAALASITASE